MREHSFARILLILLIGLLSVSGISAQDCHCVAHFEYIQTSMRLNYAGFDDKVNSRTERLYKKFTDSLMDLARKTTAELNCFDLVNAYLDYFHDKHTGIYYNNQFGNATEEQIRSHFRKVKISPMDSLKISSYLISKKSRLDPIEGIYQSEDFSYTIGIIRKPDRQNEFEGIVIRSTNKLWKPGDVKMEINKSKSAGYHAVFYNGNHNPVIPGIRLAQNVLQLTRTGFDLYKIGLEKENAPVATPSAGEYVIPARFNQFYFEKLSPSTVLIRVPDFFRQNKTKLDSMIGANLPIILSTPNMIIDVRHNGGGQDFVYDSLLALAYTNEIQQYNILVRASAENIRLYDSLGAKTTAAEMKKAIGGWLTRKVDPVRKDTVYPFPKQIALLTDRKVGSSGEQFILSMKQSGKVTVIGQNTSGTLDYGEPIPVPVPGTNWILQRPTSKHGRLPEYSVDLQGITPDVYPPAYEDDWIDFAKRMLEKRLTK